jgi:hypothetical protein
MRMKIRKIEEKKAVSPRFIEETDKKSGKKEIEELIKNGRLIDGVKMLLEEMLRFLAEMPTNKYHDYRDFRHRGLRDYLINRFLREKWNEDLCRSSARA